jgi:hypothetical protein
VIYKLLSVENTFCARRSEKGHDQAVPQPHWGAPHTGAKA